MVPTDYDLLVLRPSGGRRSVDSELEFKCNVPFYTHDGSQPFAQCRPLNSLRGVIFWISKCLVGGIQNILTESTSGVANQGQPPMVTLPYPRQESITMVVVLAGYLKPRWSTCWWIVGSVKRTPGSRRGKMMETTEEQFAEWWRSGEIVCKNCKYYWNEKEERGRKRRVKWGKVKISEMSGSEAK